MTDAIPIVPAPLSNTGRLFDRVVKRHPYITLFLLCLLVDGLFDATVRRTLLPDVRMAATALLAGAVFLFTACCLSSGWRRWQACLSGGLGAAWVIFWTIGMTKSTTPVRFFVFSGFLLLIGAGLMLKLAGRLTPQKWALMLMAAGFLLRLAYILYTTVTQRQHDVWFFDNYKGHAGYIQYLVDSNLRLPDFDPLSHWQFYHPPLHHLLAAAWMKLHLWLGFSVSRAQESIQVLTLFYSCACMITGYKILRLVKLRGLALLAPFSLLCFHPTFIILSGSINNDILSIALALGAILTALQWYRDPTIKNILKIALCVGLSMSAKLSGVLVAPAIAVIFLVWLCRNRGTPGKCIKSFAAFAAVCFPLGLWWSIRNLVRFGTPVSYVPMFSDTDPQYIGNIPILNRLFDFRPQLFSSVFMAWGDGSAGYYEYNPVIGLLKTSMFGEFDLAASNASITPAAVTLFIVNLLLVLLAVGCIAYFLIKKTDKLDAPMKGFWGVLFGVQFLSYMQFCLIYAHTCTQNFRYMVPSLLVGLVFIGFLLQRLDEVPRDVKWKRNVANAVRAAITCAAVLFCSSSAYIYTILSNK